MTRYQVRVAKEGILDIEKGIGFSIPSLPLRCGKCGREIGMGQIAFISLSTLSGETVRCQACENPSSTSSTTP